MIRKSLRKDYQSLSVEWAFSKLEADLKLKSTKSRTEFKMLSVLPELQLKKVLSLEEAVLFYMLQKLWITFKPPKGLTKS